MLGRIGLVGRGAGGSGGLDGLRDHVGEENAVEHVEAAGDGGHVEVACVSFEDFPSILSLTSNCKCPGGYA